MKLFYKRVKNRFINTIRAFKNDCKFSYKLAIYRLLDEFFGRIGLTCISKKAHIAKDEYILSYLKDLLSDVLIKCRLDTEEYTKDNDAPIWVCWWTGEESAPPIVKRCIRSIREQSNGHRVNFIDKNNYSEYIEIPKYILDKVESGDMCLAIFADYVRVSLLNKFGGLWIDSTIFCSRAIPEEYFSYPFFSIKRDERECGYISKLRWTTFFLGSFKNNPLVYFIKTAFETYWNNHENAIDYLLFDYLIELGYREIPQIKLLIDNVPINNIHVDDLQAAMNANMPSDSFDNIINKNTVLYKLSWRETYETIDSNGNETVFNHYLNT